MCTECTLNLCHLVYFNQDYCVFYLLFLIGLCFQPFFITPLTWLGQLNIERNVMFHLFIVYFLLNLNFSFSVLTHFKHSQLQCMVFKHWTMRHVLVIVPINTQKVSLTLTRNPPRLKCAKGPPWFLPDIFFFLPCVCAAATRWHCSTWIQGQRRGPSTKYQLPCKLIPSWCNEQPPLSRWIFTSQ